jgi:hypothetical protein
VLRTVLNTILSIIFGSGVREATGIAVDMRIGVHSGNVLCGIIGIAKHTNRSYMERQSVHTESYQVRVIITRGGTSLSLNIMFRLFIKPVKKYLSIKRKRLRFDFPSTVS